jgi:hypothetical protein
MRRASSSSTRSRAAPRSTRRAQTRPGTADAPGEIDAPRTHTEAPTITSGKPTRAAHNLRPSGPPPSDRRAPHTSRPRRAPRGTARVPRSHFADRVSGGGIPQPWIDEIHRPRVLAGTDAPRTRFVGLERGHGAEPPGPPDLPPTERVRDRSRCHAVTRRSVCAARRSLQEHRRSLSECVRGASVSPRAPAVPGRVCAPRVDLPRSISGPRPSVCAARRSARNSTP